MRTLRDLAFHRIEVREHMGDAQYKMRAAAARTVLAFGKENDRLDVVIMDALNVLSMPRCYGEHYEDHAAHTREEKAERILKGSSPMTLSEQLAQGAKDFVAEMRHAAETHRLRNRESLPAIHFDGVGPSGT